MKPLKLILFGAGALVLLVVIGVVVLVATFDANRYKGEIEAVVKEKTGRTLKLEGDVKVAIFPSLGARVSRVSLSERNVAQEFLSLDSAHVSVALLPLLHGEVIVDRIRVSGLKARIVKGKDGKFNFDDLLEVKGEKAVAEKKAPEKSGQGVRFDIAGVSIDRSSVSYQDLKSGQELSLADVKLATGRVSEKADGKLEFAATAVVSAKGKPATDVRVNLKGGYQFDLPAKTFALPSISAEVALSGGDLPRPVKVSTSGSVHADLGKESVNAELTSKIDDSTIKAKLGITKFSAPAYTFDIDVDRLNLDQYFPPKPKAGAPAPAGKGGGDAAKAEDTPVDLSALKGLNANGKLQCGALQVNGLKLANLKAEVHAANGRLDLSPHSANLYDGTLAGALGLQADGNRVTLKETMTNVSIGPLLRDAAQQDRLEGRGNVTLDVGGGGPTVNAIKRSLGGSAKVNLRDGAIKGIDLGALLDKVKSLGGRAEEGSANGKDQTKFTELNATFAIRNGVATNNDLDVKAPLIRVGGAGDIDIGNSSINYVVKPALVATAKGQGGEGAGQLSGVTVPVKLSGPFDSMRYEVDYGAVAADLAKSEAGKKAKEALDKNKDKLEGQVRDRLKGLFGR